MPRVQSVSRKVVINCSNLGQPTASQQKTQESVPEDTPPSAGNSHHFLFYHKPSFSSQTPSLIRFLNGSLNQEHRIQMIRRSFVQHSGAIFRKSALEELMSTQYSNPIQSPTSMKAYHGATKKSYSKKKKRQSSQGNDKTQLLKLAKHEKPSIPRPQKYALPNTIAVNKDSIGLSSQNQHPFRPKSLEKQEDFDPFSKNSFKKRSFSHESKVKRADEKIMVSRFSQFSRAKELIARIHSQDPSMKLQPFDKKKKKSRFNITVTNSDRHKTKFIK